MNAMSDRLGAGCFNGWQTIRCRPSADCHRKHRQVCRTRSITAGNTESLKGAPLRKALGLRASTGT
jgi:hypothetical protein